MPLSFRNGLYAGLLAAVILGLYLVALWRPERQVRLHTAHLLSQIEKRNWQAAAEFIGNDYQDGWGLDRAILLERLREVFRLLPSTRIEANDPQVRTETVKGLCTARITITGGAGEFASVIQARVNSLTAPFEFEWRRQSSKPWDWKLVSVRNPALEVSDL
ncbi:MAG: hypothetical protein M3N12_01225 [Verrucomicrobiota bacterium]|nr:hypothetical protein [Verrucomicrobiota bacterium]